MLNKEKIINIMDKYEIIENDLSNNINIKQFSFNKNGFYYTLSNRVKKYFLINNLSYKANYFWYFKSIIQFFIFFDTFIIACYYKNINIYLRCLLNMISANFMFQVCGYSFLHEGAHFSISKNKNINNFFSIIGNSLLLWDNQIWNLHHCFKHHSFTGTIKDPDIYHMRPFIRKSKLENLNKIIKVKKTLFPFYTFFILIIFPGFWFGQVLSYNIFLYKKYLWKMKLNNYKINYFELLLKISMYFSLLQTHSLSVSYFFILSCNITYFLTILPDHDMFETHNNLVKETENVDWGELQVRNSGNFSNNFPLINYLYGGINYQIEHHLFPTINHVHFPEIKKIVKETCKEFDIKYVEHKNIFDAIKSSLKNLYYLN
jgi:linoleoyl-CoA desaturase